MDTAPQRRVSMNSSNPTSPGKKPGKAIHHLRINSESCGKLTRTILPILHRRVSLLPSDLSQDTLIDDPHSALPARSSLGNPRDKRFSVILNHSPFPVVGRQDSLYPEGQPIRKSAAQLKQEMALLETLGVKTSSAMPSELLIFKDKPKTKLVMSSFDLWGPEHTKQVARAMGCSEAYRTLEGRDRRSSLKLETFLEPKFNSRMADDVSTMKALNTPMVMTTNFPDARPSLLTDRGKAQPVPKRAQALVSILDSCNKLSLESRAIRKSLAPIASIPVLRKKTGLRNSIS